MENKRIRFTDDEEKNNLIFNSIVTNDVFTLESIIINDIFTLRHIGGNLVDRTYGDKLPRYFTVINPSNKKEYTLIELAIKAKSGSIIELLMKKGIINSDYDEEVLSYAYNDAMHGEDFNFDSVYVLVRGMKNIPNIVNFVFEHHKELNKIPIIGNDIKHDLNFILGDKVIKNECESKLYVESRCRVSYINSLISNFNRGQNGKFLEVILDRDPGLANEAAELYIMTAIETHNLYALLLLLKFVIFKSNGFDLKQNDFYLFTLPWISYNIYKVLLYELNKEEIFCLSHKLYHSCSWYEKIVNDTIVERFYNQY